MKDVKWLKVEGGAWVDARSGTHLHAFSLP
jgi:hypothetical protein